MTQGAPPTSAALIPRNALASFDLDSLLASAARLRPDRVALADSTGASLTHDELDRRASGLAARLVELGLVPGECLLVAGGARAATIVAMIAAARAGLDVALASDHLDGAALGVFAAATGAVAMAAEPEHDGLAPLGALFEAAAAAPRVRLVCGLGGGDGDGALALDWRGGQTPAESPRRRAPREGLVLTGDGEAVLRHEQQAIISAAMDIVSRARVGLTHPILSTLSPTTFAGLAAGPFAALLAGCELRLHGPFDAGTFLDALDSAAPAHLVAPRALADALARGGQTGAGFASLMLSGNAPGEPPPAPLAGVPFVDLDGFDGRALARPASLLESRDTMAHARKRGAN